VAGERPPKRPVPARVDALDRRAVERVLARAAELQASRGGGADAAELISETQLVEIAHEAGLDTGYVRQALAEERAFIPDITEGGWIVRAFGPARVASGRTVPGSATDLLAALDRWLQKEECMRLQRRFPERITWEPRSDFWGQVRRDLGIGSSSYDLAKADTVGATAVDLGEGQALVAMEADLGEKRRNSVTAGVAFTVIGFAVAAVASGFVVPAAVLIPAAAGTAMGWATARAHRKRAAKVQLAIEQALDKIEYGEVRPPRTLADTIAAATRPLLR
jgi:hypothetical protein